MPPDNDHPPIAGRYAVDLARPLQGAGGGLPAFAVSDQRSARTDLIAVAVKRSDPARANVLHDLDEPIENLLHPIAHGTGPGPGYYVVCPAPPGPALSASTQPWPEAALIAHVLRPIAQVLQKLEIRRLTHRAIRPNNVFAASPGQPVTLGCAWAAPPALHQPPAYEPFYNLMCHPAARGDGVIADDVYALGCLLVALATGQAPMAGASDAIALRRKLDAGSFAAVAGDVRLPAIIADLTRGMLAEDPDHRPTPAMLLDPASARGRRVAARPPRRAPRPFTVGTTSAWDVRSLAYAIGREPENGARALRDGSATNWIRRGLGDAGLCTRVEELVRHRVAEPQDDHALGDMLLTMRAVATLEPLAPLCWHGSGIWPDGLGPALAAGSLGDPDLLRSLEALVATEAIGLWAVGREERCDPLALRTDAQTHRSLLRIRPPVGGISRLVHTLNPLLPCGGAVGEGQWVAGLDTMAPAMEAAILRSGGQGTALFDGQAVAFLAAHGSRELEMEVNALAAEQTHGFPAMPWLRILATLQGRAQSRKLPALARWMATQADPLIAGWHNRDRRTALRERLRVLTEEGMFAPILAALDDPAGRDADANAADSAGEALARIDRELAHIAAAGGERAALATRYGQEAVAGLGLAATAIMLAAAVFG